MSYDPEALRRSLEARGAEAEGCAAHFVYVRSCPDCAAITGRNIGYTDKYIDLCRTKDRCLKHYDRPAVPPLPGSTRPTLACEECAPKKIRKLRMQAASVRYTGGNFPKERYDWRERWGYTEGVAPCAYCQRKTGEKWLKRHLDHVVPISRGGKDVLSNLVPACGRCNSSKGAKLLWTEWTPPAPTEALLAAFPPPVQPPAIPNNPTNK